MKSPWLGLILIMQLTAIGQELSLPKPNQYQLAWHEKEFYLFMHFGPNTFTDREWGEGTEPESIFNPFKLDCRQWTRIAKEAGATGIIITAKHHDGFCLWPSKFSTHTVRESNWKNGKGDVLKELSQACREAGIKFGVYISPWDRNHPDYGTEKYNDVFTGMMKEIFTSYGPVWELWWDGANGEGPNGKRQVYDWRRYENTVRKLSPSTVIFSDIGPDIRWVGNEKGIAGDPNWNYLDTAGFQRGHGAPPGDTLNHGNYSGRHWIPGECDVSIRPGWFWHAAEDSKVKQGKELFQLYLKSVGRGANLLLNVPPDSNGLIKKHDIKALKEFRKLRDKNFSVNLLKGTISRFQLNTRKPVYRTNNNSGAYFIELKDLIIEFPRETYVNCIVLKEAIQRGQTIRKFNIAFYNNDKLVHELKGTSIGRKRIISFPGKNITSFRVLFDKGSDSENVSVVAAYNIDESLIEN